MYIYRYAIVAVLLYKLRPILDKCPFGPLTFDLSPLVPVIYVCLQICYKNVVLSCSPGTVEYRETITIINRVVEEHKSTMTFAQPDLDWCDLAVQVS